MTLEKAIEILDCIADRELVFARLDEANAIRLGIEALKEVKRIPLRDIHADRDPLSGETEE